MNNQNWKKQPVTSGEKALMPEQIEKLIAVIDDLQDSVLIKLTLATGMRRSDIVNVMTKNINQTNNSVTYYQKKKNNIHHVFVSDEVINITVGYIKLMRKTLGKTPKWLFPTSNPKNHISDRTVYNILRKYTRKAGLPDIPFHALRATCIKQCQRMGWTANETARHVDDRLDTIERHYATPSQDEMKKAANEKAVI